MKKAIKTGIVPFEAHLEECPACRKEFDILREFPISGQTPLRKPSAQAVDRFAAIPLLYKNTGNARHIAGAVTFDSWSQQPLAQLRDAGIGLTRRICLEAGNTRLEIMAEQKRDGWEFVARVYQAEKVSSEYILRVGRQKLLPRSQGFFHWSSKRAPRILRLASDGVEIDFEGLKWL
ncbi:MAG: hypothetical protein PVH24_00710 [Candidatus Zixiibacteriota bacterium]|jgi:hypothetical protein